jgi:hypothetical protein
MKGTNLNSGICNVASEQGIALSGAAGARLLRALGCACLCLLLLIVPARYAGAQAPAPAPPAKEDPEVKLGRENAEANDKQVKLVTDAAMVERVNRIGQEIATVANTYQYPALWGDSTLKKFNYTFKIVDEKDVNAYSLPGGFIYVNKGLLTYCHSDDELAGVLAHEITHAAHHHMIKLIAEQAKMNRTMFPVQIAALAAMIIGHGRSDGGAGEGVLVATQMIAIAKLNGYGVEAEKDADHGGMLLLTHTHFNPVGLYSFMLREARDEALRAVDLGIFKNHPPGDERAQAAHDLLVKLDIPIDLASVDPSLALKVSPAGVDANGKPIESIAVVGVILCKVTAADGMTAEQRATKVADRLKKLIYNTYPLQPMEIRVTQDKKMLTARHLTILTEADAEAQQKTLDALREDLCAALIHCHLKEEEENGL